MLVELVCFGAGYMVGYYGMPAVVMYVKSKLPRKTEVISSTDAPASSSTNDSK